MFTRRCREAKRRKIVEIKNDFGKPKWQSHRAHTQRA